MKKPLSSLTMGQVQAQIRGFDVRYKRDWRAWMATYDAQPLTAVETVAGCRTVLSKWQAVRSKTKGRTIRPLKGTAPPGTRCLDDVLAEAVVPVQALGGTTIRDLRKPADPERDALTRLWAVFRDLPTIGQAKAVGITKAVQLVTGGRIGPALDSLVRKHLVVRTPETAEQWFDVLQFVAEDICTFETTNQCRLEDLVEREWQPVAVGRAYDMVFGPRDSDGDFICVYTQAPAVQKAE